MIGLWGRLDPEFANIKFCIVAQFSLHVSIHNASNIIDSTGQIYAFIIEIYFIFPYNLIIWRVWQKIKY